MKIAIGAVVAGIVVIIAIALTVRFFLNKKKQKKGTAETQKQIQKKIVYNRKGSDTKVVSGSENPDDIEYTMQYVPSGSPDRKRPSSKGTDFSFTSQNLTPSMSQDSNTLKSFVNDNDTSRRPLHDQEKRARNSDFDLLSG